MAQFTISIPDEFMPLLDQLMVQSNAGTREICVRQIIGNFLVTSQVQKELEQQYQSRVSELSTLWTS